MVSIRSATDYSPFGVQLENRNFLKTGLAEDFRMGFQGQEEDDEVKGEGNSGDFLSAQEFHLALEDAIDDVEFGNNDDLSKFWIWFAPTSVWDDFVGEKGADLGNRIFERVDKWEKANS